MIAEPSPDRRARRSRAALQAALLSLIGERDLARISVSDVTKRADVNRSTFYEHYADVPDLAAAACARTFDELIAATPVLLPGDDPDERRLGREALAGVFAHFAEHAGLYRAVLGPGGGARVINHLHRRLTIAVHVNLVGPRAGTHADDPSDVPHDPVAAYLAGAVLGAAADWLGRGCPGTPEELSAALVGAYGIPDART
ncbi:TetR family transcriptional regulator [Actinomadura sp. CNU-125]|uniref:TetR/AcrR family transcriptional regulator n=1 Tax=Actinomadura sp. CNU-125 TaxID=1904961 RepID=UPI000960F9A8|nr:TetR/AcrR family transcriptional regulator [Actinomadura sp. CNU-125]OLT30212.1 TetR family transcriptional regulator [Actinomadura sp. CNU-125]